LPEISAHLARRNEFPCGQFRASLIDDIDEFGGQWPACIIGPFHGICPVVTVVAGQ
jgi:hypothetical protein